jgi:hypothetical protein
MAQGGTVCPECATVVAPGTRFCGECGAKIPQASQAPSGAPPAADSTHTIMGIDAESVRFAAALAQVEARAKSDAEARRKAQAEAEAKAKADEEAKAEAEAKAREEAEARAQAEAEAEAKANAEAEAKEREDAAAKERDEAEAQKDAEASSDADVAKSADDADAEPETPNDAQADDAEAKAESAPATEATPEAAAKSGDETGADEPSDPDGQDDQEAKDALARAETELQLNASPSAAGNPAPAANQPPTAASDALPAGSEQPAAAKTLGPRVITPERGTPGAARAAVQTAKRGLSHTMLGLSDEMIKASSSASPTGPASSVPPARDGLPRGITPTPSGKSGPKATLLGIQTTPARRTLDQTHIEGEPDMAAAARAVDSALSASSDLSSTRVEGSGRGTALGLGIPQAQPKRNAPQGRTMLGVPVASISPPPGATSSGTASRSSLPAARTEDASEPPPSIPPSPPGHISARSRNVLILGSLALLSIIVMVLVRLSGSSNNAEVSARIMTGADGETLLFEVPDAREGSSIRFGGQEQPLVAGKATFALASDSLRVGENVVLADVVTPDGDTSSARIVLSVFYRIWVDTSNLRVDKPTVDVMVTAVPGTKVALEGQDVALDDQGRATKTYPIDIRKPGKGGVIEHVVHYRMQPPSGEPVVDELHTRIAVAMMQIDRPGPDIVTDRESIEIAGAVGRETQVDIDGTAVPVKDGRFVYTLALPKAGDYKPRVTAKSTGKIPSASTLNIKRVRDLAQAAREFTFDKDLSYAKLAAAPTQYKGQAIAMEGRVYATVPRAGSSVIQMLARPCPSAQRCSVWVVDPQGTEVSVDKFVRVLGIVDGEQQFRSEKNEIVTVPKIIARFVLPAKP